MEELKDKLKLNTLETCMHQVQKDIGEIKELLHDMEGKFVSKEEFWPVKTITYGLVSVILVSVVTALVYLVIKN